mgnify:CR=1 FL=1
MRLSPEVAQQVTNLNVTFAVDRAGFVGADGATHHGAYDLSFIRCIPNIVLMVPSSLKESWQMLDLGYNLDNPSIVRYPRGTGEFDGYSKEKFSYPQIELGRSQVLRDIKSKITILFFGPFKSIAMKLGELYDARVVNMRFVKPIDIDEVNFSCQNSKVIVTLEENAKFGQPEINLGTIPAAGGTQRLVKSVGKSKAMELVLSGKIIDAKEALDFGLISECVPIEKLNNQGIQIWISNFNDPSQIVISSYIDDMNYLKSNPKALSAKRVIPLEVAGAFHTEIVSSAKKPLESSLNEIDISEGKIPVYMNVDAKKVEVSTLKENLVNQIDNSVLFNQQIEFVNNDIDPDLWCHIGPGNVTAGMVRKSISYKDLKVINSLESSK